jgi:hypothetical protein
MNNPEPKKKHALIIITIILASLLVLFFSFAFLPKLIGGIIEDGLSTLYSGGWGGLVMTWTYIVFIIGLITVWWHKLIGGIIIVVSSILQMAPFLIIEGNLGSLIFGIPLLVVGILFLVIPEINPKKMKN